MFQDEYWLLLYIRRLPIPPFYLKCIYTTSILLYSHAICDIFSGVLRYLFRIKNILKSEAKSYTCSPHVFVFNESGPYFPSELDCWLEGAAMSKTNAEASKPRLVTLNARSLSHSRSLTLYSVAITRSAVGRLGFYFLREKMIQLRKCRC